jgi:GMP synthase-like glutamine amidotransferase
VRAHYLQHVPFEGLGSIEQWLHRAGYEISVTRFHLSEELPEVGDLDLLVVMGGPMSINDVDEYPWLAAEKRFIREVIGAGVPMLGICLGAQLIASALGAKVYPNSEKEIGWFPIQGANHSDGDPFRFPDEIDVFHWHGETFDLPPGAVRLAQSEGCINQAFQLGANVIGLQFHLETTVDSARAIVENCRDELVEGKYIQSETDILSAPQERYESINQLMEKLLEYLHSRE